MLTYNKHYFVVVVVIVIIIIINIIIIKLTWRWATCSLATQVTLLTWSKL